MTWYGTTEVIIEATMLTVPQLMPELDRAGQSWTDLRLKSKSTQIGTISTVLLSDHPIHLQG
jgi:hypothetical protein